MLNRYHFFYSQKNRVEKPREECQEIKIENHCLSNTTDKCNTMKIKKRLRGFSRISQITSQDNFKRIVEAKVQESQRDAMASVRKASSAKLLFLGLVHLRNGRSSIPYDKRGIC